MTLPLVPFSLSRWERGRKTHPEREVWMGARNRRDIYDAQY
jgi:hypothetical protein